MTAYNLRIGNWIAKYEPIKIEPKVYPKCDNEGNLLNYVKGEFTSGYYENESGEKVENAVFLVNGKPRAKLEKTKEVDNYKEVDIREVEDLTGDIKEYIVYCPKLQQDLTDSGKALKFGMSFGGGGKHGSMKVYITYIYPSALHNCLFMKIGLGYKSEAIAKIFEVNKQADKLKELNKSVEGVDRAKVEDLIEL